MIVFGQICLLIALIASGCSSFAGITRSRTDDRRGAALAVWASWICLAALTTVMLILAIALVTKDFRFDYVVEYSSRQLSWQYSLSALWVGQAGSLLLWAWLLIVLAHAFRISSGRPASANSTRVFGVVMAYGFFLVAVMVFAADPMSPSLIEHDEGVGLSPLLQHPAMLIHPPIIFLGYAAWTIPFALACVALAPPKIDDRWLRSARNWTLFAWTVLGIGIILGGNWAYEELGWGGYWAWDPVENGSLLPWLTGTALLHCLLAWQYRGILKKSAMFLAMTTFMLCNFATFLTRSGIFSSLHAFSQSSIGWMFLALLICVLVGSVIVIVMRRGQLTPDRSITSFWSRDALIVLANIGIALLVLVTFCGTLMVPLSDLLLGRKIVVGVAFFNNGLIPVGLLLLSASAATPLLRWGAGPSRLQRRMLGIALCGGLLASFFSYLGGMTNVLAATVMGCAGFAVIAFAASVWLDAWHQQRKQGVLSAHAVVRAWRPQYAGYIMHLGFTCLAVGIAGSSLGSVRHEVVMREGETISWSGYTVQLTKVRQTSLADKVVADVELVFSRNGKHVCTLYPAQQLHRHQDEWTTEVAIHANWSRDIYTILHGSAGQRQADLTFVMNPLTRWIWAGAWVFVLGTVVRLWPSRGPRPAAPTVARPKFLGRVRTRVTAVRK